MIATDITLTWPEVLLAANVGVMRQVQSRKAGRVTRYGLPEDSWTPSIDGACAEMAVAKAFGLYWSGAIGNLRAADVGPLQVRSTTWPNGCLILHPEDNDDEYFLLVIGAAPSFRLAGWIKARDGKQAQWWREEVNRAPAYFVPQAALCPISTLARVA